MKSGFNFHQTLLFGLDEMWFPTSITEDTHDSTNQISDKQTLDLYCLIQLCGMVDTC